MNKVTAVVIVVATLLFFAFGPVFAQELKTDPTPACAEFSVVLPSELVKNLQEKGFKVHDLSGDRLNDAMERTEQKYGQRPETPLERIVIVQAEDGDAMAFFFNTGGCFVGRVPWNAEVVLFFIGEGI